MEAVHLIFMLLVYVAGNYYIWVKLKNAFASATSVALQKALAIMISCLSISYVAAELGRGMMPGKLHRIMYSVGACWIAAMIYLLMLYGIVEVFNLCLRKFKSFSKERRQHMVHKAYEMVPVFAALIVLLGIINANLEHVASYHVNVNKKTDSMKSLNVVMMSDVHIGSMIRRGYVDKLVELVNAQDPDVVLICGDLVDKDMTDFNDEKCHEALRKIKSRHGTYAVLGNHECFSGDLETVKKGFEASGIKLLMDDFTEIDGEFYIVGREDASKKKISGGTRKEIWQLMSNVDKSKPIIVMDHEPVDIDASEKAGVDVQFSGHTHEGQFFPANLVTRFMFRKDYGLLKRESFNLVVSSGCGYWGPPVRVGTKSEIVRTVIEFKQEGLNFEKFRSQHELKRI